jgi:Uma2 family endonuclease
MGIGLRVSTTDKYQATDNPLLQLSELCDRSKIAIASASSVTAMIVHFDPKHCLPSSYELPDSDDTPVDNEIQNWIPNLLLLTLALAWSERTDWFFGVDMGIYYDPDQPAVVPDGFLSLGVDRYVGEEGRLSYVFWEEDNIPPTLALEVVSKTYGGEYKRKKGKKALYADLGIRYYAVYQPNRRSRRPRQPLEVYRLENGVYQQLEGDPFWLPEVGLALGRERGTYMGYEREWLHWYDEVGERLPTPEDRIQQQQAIAQQERDRAEKLAAKLRALGVEPDAVD